MWQMVLGLFLLVGTLTRDNFGFVGGSGGQVIGYNFASAAMIIVGCWLIYYGYKKTKAKNSQKSN